MDRGILLVVGVVAIVLIVLGYAFANVSRGVAPELTSTLTSSSPSIGGEKTSSPTTKTTSKQTGTTSPQQGGVSFQSLFLKRNQFRVDFDILNNTKKVGEGSLFIKGEKRRFDFRISEGEFRSITVNQNTYYCFRQPGAQWTCFLSTDQQTPPQVGEQAEGAEDPVKKGETEFKSPKYNGTRTYAGKLCHCFYVTSTDTLETIGRVRITAEMCLTPEGIPAYYLALTKKMDGTVVHRMEYVAKSISFTVPDAVFNPPAQPTTLPGG